MTFLGSAILKKARYLYSSSGQRRNCSPVIARYFSFSVEYARRHAGDDTASRKTVRHYGACTNNTPVAQLNIFKNYGLRTNPASVTDGDATDLHRQFFG